MSGEPGPPVRNRRPALNLPSFSFRRSIAGGRLLTTGERLISGGIATVIVVAFVVLFFYDLSLWRADPKDYAYPFLLAIIAVGIAAAAYVPIAEAATGRSRGGWN